MNLPLRFLFASAFAIPAFAQDATTAAHGPLVVVKSSTPDVVMGLSMMLGAMPDMPELADGSHYELTLGADKQTKLTTAPGAVAFIELAADPAGLMKTFAAEVQQGRAMAQMGLGMLLTQAGADAAVAKDIVTALFDFPNHLETLTMKIVGNPDEVREKGMDVALDFIAKADSGFGKAMLKMKPCSQGAPSLKGDGMMGMQMSLDPQGLQALFGPMMDTMLTMLVGAGDENAAARSVYKQWMDQYDGGMAFGFGGAGMDMLIGVLDGKKLSEMLASSEYAQMIKAQNEKNRNMEITFEPNTLQHRGASFHKMTMEGDQPNPMMPEGKMTLLIGALGNYMIMGSEASAKAMGDAAADAKVKRGALPGGAVMTMAMSMAKMSEQMGGEVPPDAPETMAMSVVPNGKDLGIRVHLK